jgi:hypothetical protein
MRQQTDLATHQLTYLIFRARTQAERILRDPELAAMLKTLESRLTQVSKTNSKKFPALL